MSGQCFEALHNSGRGSHQYVSAMHPHSGVCNGLRDSHFLTLLEQYGSVVSVKKMPATRPTMFAVGMKGSAMTAP